MPWGLSIDKGLFPELAYELGQRPKSEITNKSSQRPKYLANWKGQAKISRRRPIGESRIVSLVERGRPIFDHS